MELLSSSVRSIMQQQIEELKSIHKKLMEDAVKDLREKLGLKPIPFEPAVSIRQLSQNLIEDETTGPAYEKILKDTSENMEVVIQNAESDCLDIQVQYNKDPVEDYQRRIEPFDLLLGKQQYSYTYERMKALLKRKQKQKQKLKKQQRKLTVNLNELRVKQGEKQNVQIVFEEVEKRMVILKIIIRQEFKYVFQFDTKD